MQTSSPSSRYGCDLGERRVAHLHPDEVVDGLAEPLDHDERDRVAGGLLELVDVERERGARARGRGEMGEQRRRRRAGSTAARSPRPLRLRVSAACADERYRVRGCLRAAVREHRQRAARRSGPARFAVSSRDRRIPSPVVPSGEHAVDAPRPPGSRDTESNASSIESRRRRLAAASAPRRSSSRSRRDVLGAALRVASDLLDLNATDVTLAVHGSTALVTYQARGATRHVLAWGAVNALTPGPERAAGPVPARLQRRPEHPGPRCLGALRSPVRSVRRARRSPIWSPPARRPTARTGRCSAGSAICPIAASRRGRTGSAPGSCGSRTGAGRSRVSSCMPTGRSTVRPTGSSAA